MGRTRRIAVTAEGVETRAQADALIAAGCDRVQGYLYGRPLSATSPIF
jgi:EAL domain-containing protein (putative c-di-GMP-specific phosphodiesterase class I)